MKIQLKISVFALTLLSLVGCQTTAKILPKPVEASVEAKEFAQEKQPFQDFQAIKKQTDKPIVALVLGSGGARGYAHIGAIEVLEAAGVQPDFIVGTSAGSIVGSIYASGKSAAELKQIALDMKVNDVRDITIDRKGFFDGKKVEDFVNEQVDQLALQDMKIPMFVVATELKEGKRTIFNYGNTGQAVRASVAIPSMFIPATIADKEYVDGGLVSPVAVKFAKELGADIVIAVDILAQPTHTETTNVWGLFNQNINIMQKHLAEEELQLADVVIQPDLKEKGHIFDVRGRTLTMQAGAEAATHQLNQIKTVYAKHKTELVMK